jgi:glycosyltransferase involved in cell wall biosynthesis
MKILFMHQNFPGQFKHLARHFAVDAQNEVLFITRPKAVEIPGVTKHAYKLHRKPRRDIHHYVSHLESSVLYGQAAGRVMLSLKNKGYVPDVIVAHPGWGESLYTKDIYPDVPLLNYCEFYYLSSGSDVGFDPEIEVTVNDFCRIRTKNANNLLSLEACDAGLSPTKWQRDQFPREYAYKIALIHDGINTDVASPDPKAALQLPNGKTVTRKDEVVTYIARNLEPYRGFPVFMRAAEEICRRRPNCQIIVVGGDGVSYGRRPPKGQTYRSMALNEVTIDPERVHFLGWLAYERFLKVVQASSVHVYLTFPFVLSWSMLEMMSAEGLVIASATPPVTEIIEEGKNGLLFDFFDHKAIADRVDEVLDHKTQMAQIRKRARKTILERYELSACMKKQIELIQDLANGNRPSQEKPATPPA